MRTRLIVHPSMKRRYYGDIFCELERNDKYDYVKFHFVDKKGAHISSCNIFNISISGCEMFFGIGDDNIDAGEIKIIGVDLL